MLSTVTTFSSAPLRRFFSLEDLTSEIHSHNMTKGRVVDFGRKNESLRSTVSQAEQTVTFLRQQLTSRDERRVGIRLEYDVSAFVPFYASPTENNIGRVARHMSLVQQQGQKRKMTHEDLEVDVKRRKRATKSGPHMAADSGGIEPCRPCNPAIQAAFDLLELSNASKDGEQLVCDV